MSKSQEGRKRKKNAPEECLLPELPPMPRLGGYVLKRTQHEERAVRDYVEEEAHGETVTHLEKVATERVFERRLDAWDVRTDHDRYWVITNPTNLYRQDDFQSLDVLISFHIGLTTRVMARREPPVSDEQQQRLAAAWRRWTQAAEALDQADEAEEFQAVGMRCRECLLEFIRAIADRGMVPEGQDAPKRGDFVHWAELAAQTIASGESTERVRGYLKAISGATWPLVNWLTHAKNAVRLDGQIAVDATQNVLVAFGTALLRYERGLPDRCPVCSSYRITSDYRPDLDIDPPYVALCESCGWLDPARDARLDQEV